MLLDELYTLVQISVYLSTDKRRCTCVGFLYIKFICLVIGYGICLIEL